MSDLGYLPINQTKEFDVFVVGYPKSGNTWFQNIIASLLLGLTPEFTPDCLIQEIVPDVHHKKRYKRFTDPVYFKSHFLPRPEYRKVVYLIRDGRDVMVSYFHYLEEIEKKKMDDKSKLIRFGYGLPFGKWLDHVESWMLNPYGADMLIIKYENMRKDLLCELKRFCEFALIDRDEFFLQQVVVKVSFQNMRKQEERFGWDRPNWPKEARFVRRGVVGSHKDEMESALYEELTKEAKKTLERFGYL